MDEVPQLLYGSNAGCCAYISDGGPPHQCGAEEAFAVPHEYKYPRPSRTRLYVCRVHGEQHPDAEPLTKRDRAIIRARHADRDAALRRARRPNP